MAQQPAPAGGTTQQMPVATEGTAAVSGVVTDTATKQPIAGVMVYLGFQGRGAVGRLSRQLSDAKGRFVFTDLPAGNNYFINASKFGYLEGHVGVGAGGLLGGLITLTDGQWVNDVSITMDRPGAISGTIRDERGEPAVGAFVRVLARISVAGRMRLASGQTVKTDDRGVYRLPALAPGRYIVQVPSVQQTMSATLTAADLAGLTPEQLASGRKPPDPPPSIDFAGGTRLIVGGYLPPPAPIDGRAQVYPPLFHPGVTSIAASTPIDVRAGEENTGVDVSLRPVPAASILGVVDGPPEALAGAVVRLLPDGLEELGMGGEAATATLGADGRFSLLNVPAGSYTIDIRRTIAELQYRPALSGATIALPSTPGMNAGGGSGAILSGPSDSMYSFRGSRGNALYFAQQRVVVEGGPISDLVVTLRRGATIRGKLVMDTGNFPDSGSASMLAALPVMLEPADGNVAQGLVQGRMTSATTFEIESVGGGQFFIRLVALPIDGRVLSVMGDDGVDHRFKPFDTSTGRDFDVTVTVTTKRTDLSGMATDSKGAQVKGAVAVVFPVEREQWTNYGLTPARLKATPTTSSGTYRFQSLPAGDYYVVGVPPDQSTIWQDPAKLALLAQSARRVTLVWGEVTKLDVTVVRVQ